MKALRLLTIAALLCVARPAFGQGDLQHLQTLVRTGRAAEALPELLRMVEASPKNLDAVATLGRAYVRLGKLDSAQIAGQRAVKLDDGRPDGYIVIARALVQANKSDEAYKSLRSGLKKRKNDPSLLTELGHVMLAMDSLQQAIVIFTRAIDTDPGNLRALEGLGDAYMKQAIPTMAAIQYEKIVAVDSLDEGVNFKLAQAYMKERRYGEAGITYQRVLSLDSTNLVATLDLAKLYYASGQFENSALLFVKYLEQNPDDKDMRPFYMEALYRSSKNGNRAEVLAVVKSVLAEDPGSVKALRIYARMMADSDGNAEEAVKSYGILDEKDSLGLDERYLYAQSLFRLKQDENGIAQLQRILELKPDLGQVLGDLGSAYMRLQKWEDAAGAFQKRLGLDSTHLASRLNFALCNMQLQKWDLAIASLREVVAEKPDYVQGWQFLAQALSRIDQTREALRSYQKVIELAAGEPEKYARSLGEAHGIIGVNQLIDKRFDAALDFLTKATRFDPNNCQYHLWRAQTLQNMNRKDDAIRGYRKVLELCPGDKEAKKGLEILNK